MGKLHSFRKCGVFAGISFGLELLKTPPGGGEYLRAPLGCCWTHRPLWSQAPLPAETASCATRGRVSTLRGSAPSGDSSGSLSYCHLPSCIEFSVCRAALHATSQVPASSLHRRGCTECQREVWAAEPGPWNWKDLAPVLVLSCSGGSASPQARGAAALLSRLSCLLGLGNPLFPIARSSASLLSFLYQCFSKGILWTGVRGGHFLPIV